MRHRTVTIADRLWSAAIWVIGLSPAFFAVVVWGHEASAAMRGSSWGSTADGLAARAPAATWRLYAGELYAAGAFALLGAVIVVSGARPRQSAKTSAARGGGLVAAAVAMYAGPVLAGVFAGHGGAGDWHLWLAPLAVIAFHAAPRLPLDVLLRRLRRILRVYTWGSLVALLVTPDWAVERNHIVNFRLPLVGSSRLLGLTGHPILMGVLAAAILAIELAPLYRTRLWLIHSGAATAVLLLAQSRTGWLAALAGVLLIYRRGVTRQVHPLVVRGLPVAIVVCASPMVPAVWNRVGQLMSSDEIGSLHGRTQVWAMVMDAFRSDVFWGYGPMLFTDPAAPPRGMFDHAHNQLMQALGTAGIVGAVGLLAFAAALAAAAARAARATAGLSWALVTIVGITCVTEAPLRGLGFSPYLLLVLMTLDIVSISGDGTVEAASAPTAPVLIPERVVSPRVRAATAPLGLEWPAP